MKVVQSWKQSVRRLKRDTYALYLAARDSRTPWPARLITACVVGYAFSPIDLIPDFIPVLGYLDDLILIPLGILLAVRLIPADVLADSRTAAEARLAENRPTNWVAAAIIVGLWLLAGIVVLLWISRTLQP
jgi:uncharacterized membrane protein YkvA (DUF1232 family)